MSARLTRRSALSTLAAAGAGLLFSRRTIRGQGRPIVIGGREVEIAVTQLGPSTVRLTVSPLADGAAVPVPDDGALVEAASSGATARHRGREALGTVSAGELRVRFTEEPPTLHVEKKRPDP